MFSRYDDLAHYNKLDKSNNVRQCVVTRFIDREPPLESKIHIVADGENLLGLAYRYYMDISLWYIIAEANPSIKDPFGLSTGQELVIPLI